MEFLLKLIITPVILLLSAKLMNGIYIKDNRAAIISSLLIIVVGFLIGWLLTLILNVLTLGLFWIVGLGIITRTIAYTVVIEIVDRFRGDFDTKGFLPSLGISVLLAIGWGIIDYLV